MNLPLNTLMKYRAIGPGIVRDMLAYIGDRSAQPAIQPGLDPKQSIRQDAKQMLGRFALEYLADAFSLWVTPQLDALDPQAIKRIHRQVGEWFKDNTKCATIQERIRQLYPHLERWDDVEPEYYE